MYEKLQTTAKAILNIKKFSPKVGIILGSGLGSFVDKVEDKTEIPYSDIPFFHDCTVEGHTGKLIFGTVNGVEVVLLQGRIHVYEGHPMEDIVYATRTLATLGIKSLLLTNASGGINLNYKPGDVINITDHINLMGTNPLVGPNLAEFGPRFPDMTTAYDHRLQECLKQAAIEVGYDLKDGIYAGMLGPTYETPAEVRMAGIVGADMVGMSTVPECIAANHMGIKVCGLSCITNMAAGIQKGKLSHDDIKQQANKVMASFAGLVYAAVGKMG